MKRINLIPHEARKVDVKAWIKACFSKGRSSKIIAATLIFFVLLFIWHGTAIFRYRLNITAQKKKIKKLQVQLKEENIACRQIQEQREKLQLQKKHIEQRLFFLQEAEKERIEWSAVLAHLSNLVPQAMWVNEASFNKDIITISGATLDNALVSKFMARLDESEYFQGTSFNYTQKAKLTDRPVINFEVTTHLTGFTE